MASNNVQRNNLRNNLNSQLICGVYGARAFGCKWHVFQSGAYKKYLLLTYLILAKIIPVPGMGDSISEGVVEEFVKRKQTQSNFNLHI